MRTHEEKVRAKLFIVSFIAILAVLAVILPQAQGKALSGGIHIQPKGPKKALLIKGKVAPPVSAPARVKGVIRAANKISNKPYLWGGGHGSWNSSGYDCSGAVSYALKGGRFISSPLSSGPLMSWGKSGKGKWVTVYSNTGHVYIVVAGFRFDTANTPGDGPRWSKSLRSTPGFFVARNPGRGF
jgi:cell wall-associated NlpC family hydrolase